MQTPPLQIIGKMLDTLKGRKVGILVADGPDGAAVQAIKQGLREALDPDWDTLGVWVSQNLARLFKTDDHKEGVASFLEKRAPVFQGS